jgi:endonuclease/exonuclease/phosphatase family metal-dependent hydrolase
MVEEQLSGPLRVATYNVHDCVGRDGVYDPRRIAKVVAGLDADVVALQEVTLDHVGDVVALLQDTTGMRAIDGTLFERGIGRYGNMLLCRDEVVAEELHDLSFAGREPRGAIQASLATAAGACHVLAAHFGLSRRERRMQFLRFAELAGRVPGPLLLMGDFNAWRPEPFRALRREGFRLTTISSFPSRPRPLLALDRIAVRAPGHIHAAWRGQGPAVAVASDHLPVVAEIHLA